MTQRERDAPGACAEVGVAQAGRNDTDQHLVAPRLLDLYVLQDEGFVRGLDDSRSCVMHSKLLTGRGFDWVLRRPDSWIVEAFSEMPQEASGEDTVAEQSEQESRSDPATVSAA